MPRAAVSGYGQSRAEIPHLSGRETAYPLASPAFGG